MKYLWGCLTPAEVDGGLLSQFEGYSAVWGYKLSLMSACTLRQWPVSLPLAGAQRWQRPCPQSGSWQGADREEPPRYRDRNCLLPSSTGTAIWPQVAIATRSGAAILSSAVFASFPEVLYHGHQADRFRESYLHSCPSGGSLLLTLDFCVGKFHLQWVRTCYCFKLKVGLHLRIYNVLFMAPDGKYIVSSCGWSVISD